MAVSSHGDLCHATTIKRPPRHDSRYSTPFRIRPTSDRFASGFLNAQHIDTRHRERVDQPLTTQLIGSYTKPPWLINHHRVTSLAGAGFWRPDLDVRQHAWDDATRLAIFEQERAGLDVITDGEQRRQRYDAYFFRFGGIDSEKLGRWEAGDRDMSFVDVDPEVSERLATAMTARVVDHITWPGPMVLDDLRFLKAHTRRPVKMTVIGPLTTACRLADEHYGDLKSLGMALADAINRELRCLDREGLDYLQIDEPDFHFRPDQSLDWGTAALDAALAGIATPTIVHVCYGYATLGRKRPDPRYAAVLEALAASRVNAIALEYEQPGHEPSVLRHCGDKSVVLGVLNLGSNDIERPEHIAERIEAALDVVPAERLHLGPDCGMWFMPRQVAFAKIRAMVLAAALVRDRLTRPATTGIIGD
jgi:5-methyltetrahydropteroyltriglutamate--homocysteine methyltransferase